MVRRIQIAVKFSWGSWLRCPAQRWGPWFDYWQRGLVYPVASSGHPKPLTFTRFPPHTLTEKSPIFTRFHLMKTQNFFDFYRFLPRPLGGLSGVLSNIAGVLPPHHSSGRSLIPKYGSIKEPYNFGPSFGYHYNMFSTGQNGKHE